MGRERPSVFLVLGGKAVESEEDDEDEAYSPPRILSPAYVKKLENALADISAGAFAKRFDRKRLSKEEIYPRIWDEPVADLLREYLAAFESIRQFVFECAAKGHALVVDLS